MRQKDIHSCLQCTIQKYSFLIASLPFTVQNVIRDKPLLTFTNGFMQKYYQKSVAKHAE